MGCGEDDNENIKSGSSTNDIIMLGSQEDINDEVVRDVKDKHDSKEDAATEEEETSDSETETLDVTIDLDNDHDTVDDFLTNQENERDTQEGSDARSKGSLDIGEQAGGNQYNDLVYQGTDFTWEEVDGAGDGMPPALLLHSRLR